MFKDTPDGQTHYENDNCGEPAHNMTNKQVEEKKEDINKMPTHYWIRGEDWNRGNDLADGSYSKETFEEIVHDIVALPLLTNDTK